MSHTIQIKLAAVLCLAWSGQACAQAPRLDEDKLGVDLLQLRSGELLFGFVLDPTDEGKVHFAIEREWLKNNQPDLIEYALKMELQDRKSAQDLLTTRVEQWIADRADDESLVRFLKAELERALRPPAPDSPPPEFLLVHVDENRIRRLVVAPPKRRHIAGLAYQFELSDVVQTPTSQLENQLEDLGVDIANHQVDLREHLPRPHKFSDKQWSAKVALVEYQIRQPLEYQGTTNQLIRVGDQLDGPQLLSNLLGGSGMDSITQLGVELGLPEFKKFRRENESWWDRAIEEAEKDGFRGVLVTRLIQSLSSSRVEVETRFLAQQDPGRWFTVMLCKTQADANRQVDEDLRRLREDPQLSQILDAAASLGLDVSDRLERALRHGAATAQALQEAKSTFNAFLAQHIESLSGPQLRLSEN